MNFIRNFKKSCLILPFFLLLFSFPALAAFNITAIPSDGGFDLRFGRLSASDFKEAKEILLTVNNDTGKPYRISQYLARPLSTNDGTELPDDQFKVYPLVNSNTRGTLLYQQELPVSASEMTFYSSDGSGSSDSMKLVYTITPSENQIAGSYYGRISYILAPTGSVQEQVVITVNIYLELTNSGDSSISIATETGSKRLFFSSKNTNRNSVATKEPLNVSIDVAQPLSIPYRIYQSLDNAGLVSEKGEQFDASKILFSLDGGRNGTLAQNGDLGQFAGKSLIYASDPKGSHDNLIISYYPAPDYRLLPSGRYKGRINYILETDDQGNLTSKVLDTLDIEIEIVPVFDIYVYSGDQEGVVLRFGQVGYKTGPKTSEVDIYIESNMGKPYQVVQKVSGPMVNEAGESLPEENFTFDVSIDDKAAEPEFYVKDFKPVIPGDCVIFSSAFDGASAHFKVTYMLDMKPDTRQGNYNTRIGYSLALK